MNEEEYKRRKDWKSYVSDDMIKLRKLIIGWAERSGKLSEDDSKFLVRFDKATRVCNKCGKPYVNTRMWSNRLFKTADGRTVPCGLEALCSDCQIEELRKQFKL